LIKKQWEVGEDKMIEKPKKINRLPLVAVIFVLLLCCVLGATLSNSYSKDHQSKITPTLEPLPLVSIVVPSITVIPTEVVVPTDTPIPTATIDPYRDWPEDATAKCKDGTYSSSLERSGTCSGHKGVDDWGKLK
jgi:hypothetical protein